MTMESKNEMTIGQALAKGYTHAGLGSVTQWQSLFPLEDMNDDMLLNDDYYLTEIDGESPKITEQNLRLLIAEHMESDWSDDTGDDRESVYKTIMGMYFEEVASRINRRLSSIKSYKLTLIKLVPDSTSEATIKRLEAEVKDLKNRIEQCKCNQQ